MADSIPRPGKAALRRVSAPICVYLWIIRAICVLRASATGPRNTLDNRVRPMTPARHPMPASCRRYQPPPASGIEHRVSSALTSARSP